MQEYLPRPAWNHKMVKEAVAKEYVQEVKDWATLHGALEEEHGDREFLALLSLALIESPDSYQAGRYIEDFWDWPVTGELIRILDRAYARMKTITRKFVLEWVVENNVRFPAKKGEGVRFRIGDLEFGGVVMEVVRSEATAIVKLNVKGKPYSVRAEEVLEVTSPAAVKEKKK